MSIKFLKVEGYESLVRDTTSSAIVNTDVSEYDLYMTRHRTRNEQSDQIRSACKEINNLKAELREIKNLIKGLVK
tara:strand:- start:130 stop:354 length:225 start_codon:yes stop_codon:yes gene_type:complete